MMGGVGGGWGRTGEEEGPEIEGGVAVERDEKNERSAIG